MPHVTDWHRAVELSNEPFYALLFAMILKADSRNIEKIRSMWPGVVNEAEIRYNSPGGYLDTERPA